MGFAGEARSAGLPGGGCLALLRPVKVWRCPAVGLAICSRVIRQVERTHSNPTANESFCSWSKDLAKTKGGNFHCFRVSVVHVSPAAGLAASYSPLYFQNWLQSLCYCNLSTKFVSSPRGEAYKWLFSTNFCTGAYIFSMNYNDFSRNGFMDRDYSRTVQVIYCGGSNYVLSFFIIADYFRRDC